MKNLINANGDYNRTEWNNGTNQDIKGRFVGREVIENINCAVEDLIKANQLDSDLGFDIFEHLQYYFTASDGEDYTQEEAEEKIEDLKQEIEVLEEQRENEDENELLEEAEATQKEIDEKEEFIEELENADFDELTEVYEYWSVSGWLGKKLEEKGQIIIDECGLCIWGRQTTGQAILLDSVISEICEDLEILQGQKSDHSK